MKNNPPRRGVRGKPPDVAETPSGVPSRRLFFNHPPGHQTGRLVPFIPAGIRCSLTVSFNEH